MKSCDFCDSRTLADDGDEYGEWATARCGASDCTGCLIQCVTCAGRAWDGDRWFRRAFPRPTADARAEAVIP